MTCIAMRPWCGVGGKFCIACAQQQPRRTTVLSPLCDGCGQRITTGRIVVTGDGEIFLHEGCVRT